MYKLNNISIEVPEDAEFILKRITEAGYEAFVVGGCVRDSLLGRVPGDWDITTSALPEQVKSLFAYTADTGIQHGTVMVLKGGCGYEVTTYRIDGDYKDGRHPESVEFTRSLEEDLKRRDFTINAFAYNPETGVVDMFDGISDLNNGCIRAVGDPYRRFDEDALRIMRAVRFSAQLSFEIEETTKNAITSFAERLSLVSMERIRVEFEKTLFSANPSYVNEYKYLGLGKYIVPEVSEKCFDEASCSYYEKLPMDMELSFEKDEAERRFFLKVLRLSAFFKNLTEAEAKKAIRKMTFDNRSRDLVSGILRFRSFGPAKTRAQLKHILKETGLQLFELVLCFREAAGEDMTSQRKLLSEVTENNEAYCIAMLAVNGNDLIEAGVPKGAAVGKVLSELLEKVIEDPALNKKETLVEAGLKLI